MWLGLDNGAHLLIADWWGPFLWASLQQQLSQSAGATLLCHDQGIFTPPQDKETVHQTLERAGVGIKQTYREGQPLGRSPNGVQCLLVILHDLQKVFPCVFIKLPYLFR